MGLVPSASTIRSRDPDIAALAGRLGELEAFGTATYSGAFSPNEIPVEDNVRGMFVFAPGPEAEAQVTSALKRGLTYFAREYAVANEFGATYAAAFEHELYICRNGAVAMRPQAQVTEALLQSQLPIFQALTPSPSSRRSTMTTPSHRSGSNSMTCTKTPLEAARRGTSPRMFLTRNKSNCNPR